MKLLVYLGIYFDYLDVKRLDLWSRLYHVLFFFLVVVIGIEKGRRGGREAKVILRFAQSSIFE